MANGWILPVDIPSFPGIRIGLRHRPVVIHNITWAALIRRTHMLRRAFLHPPNPQRRSRMLRARTACLVGLALGAGPSGHGGGGPQGDAAAAGGRRAQARQRPQGPAARGPLGAGGQRPGLVPRRLQGRAQGAQRLRPPLRAPDVQGLGEPRAPRSTRTSSRRSAGATTPPPTSTAPSTSRPSPATTWSGCCGWRPTACAPSTSRTRTSSPSATW